jgi:hypothetical protein
MNVRQKIAGLVEMLNHLLGRQLRVGVVALVGLSAAQAQKISDSTGGGALAATVAFGSASPFVYSSIVARSVDFRIWSTAASGYNVTASAILTVTPTATDSNGDPIKATDIGFGVTSIVPGNQAITPRADAIAPGYGYDPQAVSVNNGLTPYQGAANGSATLADLLTTKKILSGNRIGGNPNGNRYLTVTMKVGLLPQFFTPATFSGIITLTIADGP